MCAQYHVIMLYVAYGLYGVMQAGSELGWHMSGPCFAQEKDSTVFSSTNVLMVGILVHALHLILELFSTLLLIQQ